jgi:hypothetical protein
MLLNDKMNTIFVSDTTKNFLLKEFLHIFNKEGHTELTMVFAYVIINGHRQPNGDIDIRVGDLSHSMTILTEDETPVPTD